MGSEAWDKVFNTKREVLDQLWSAVRKTLKPPYRAIAGNFIAEGDYVTIEAIGRNSTPEGLIYQNKYCWVCHIVGGKIRELKEYMDTALVTRTFAEAPVKIIGERFLFDFDLNKAIIYFVTEDTLQFTITQKAGLPHHQSETVEIEMMAIRPNLYKVIWTEASGNTVMQIQDFQNMTVSSTWVLPGGQLNSAWSYFKASLIKSSKLPMMHSTSHRTSLNFTFAQAKKIKF